VSDGPDATEIVERAVLLCFLAGRSVVLDEDDLNAALRRAELLLAAGGDPHRPLELEGRAVGSLADDLDKPRARTELAAALTELGGEFRSEPDAMATLDLLAAEPDLAWRCFAMALLAEALGSED
jgi:hypothetical protein